MSGRPLAAKMKCLLSACCFFSALALSTAGKLEDSDGLCKTFHSGFFSSLPHLGFRADVFQCSVMCMDANWLDVFICGHILRRMNINVTSSRV